MIYVKRSMNQSLWVYNADKDRTAHAFVCPTNNYLIHFSIPPACLPACLPLVFLPSTLVGCLFTLPKLRHYEFLLCRLSPDITACLHTPPLLQLTLPLQHLVHVPEHCLINPALSHSHSLPLFLFLLLRLSLLPASPPTTNLYTVSYPSGYLSLVTQPFISIPPFERNVPSRTITLWVTGSDKSAACPL